jgi:hypothetical protein
VAGVNELADAHDTIARLERRIAKLERAGTTHISLGEITAPGSAPADSVRVYAVDNGAGKTKLMAIFESGAAQQIAIEP